MPIGSIEIANWICADDLGTTASGTLSVSSAGRRPRYPFRFDCAQCPAVEIVYAIDDQDSDIKITGRAWKRNPGRCRYCVLAADQIRTGVLGLRP